MTVTDKKEEAKGAKEWRCSVIFERPGTDRGQDLRGDKPGLVSPGMSTSGAKALSVETTSGEVVCIEHMSPAGSWNWPSEDEHLIECSTAYYKSAD